MHLFQVFFVTNALTQKKKTIGVGNFGINNHLCIQCVDNLTVYDVKEEPIIMHSVGTTTEHDGTAVNNDIHICDKCNATIHSLAQSFTAQNKKICDISERIAEKSSMNLFLPVDKDSVLDHNSEKSNSITKANLNFHSNVPKSMSLPFHESLKESEIPETERVAVDLEVLGKSRKLKMVGAVTENRIKEKEISEESISEDKIQCSATLSITENKKEYFESSFNPFEIISQERTGLSKELKAACKVFNDHLQKPDRSSEIGIHTSLHIIKQEWFQIANQKEVNPHLIEDYLDAFEEFSKPFLRYVVNLADNNGNTAIHYAVSYSNFDVVSILIDSKVCDVNKQNKAGYTCIMLVALADIENDAHRYVVQRLFSIGDINIKATQNGQTALMLAVSHGKMDIVKMLVEAGAEINLQDNDGSTALMCAAEHGRCDIVRFFLLHPECDPAITDSDGSNALTIAMEAGHKDIGLLIYASMNFSRGSSPYSSLKHRRRSTPRSTPPPRTPTLRTPPLPSPSAWSTSSLPNTFHFTN